MSEKTEAIKADIRAAKNSLTQINADILRLDEKIQSATTVQELDEIKEMSSDLAAAAQQTDEMTPEEETNTGDEATKA